MGKIMKVSICIKNKGVRNIIYHYLKSYFDVVVDLYNDRNDIYIFGRNYDLIICEEEEYVTMNIVNSNINDFYSRILCLSKQQLANQDWKNIIFKKIKTNESKWIELDIKGKRHQINWEDIIFIEMLKNDSYVYTQYCMVKCRKTMKEWIEVLPYSSFVQVHRSYIVAHRYIQKLNKYTITLFLKNGEYKEIPISKARWNEVIDKHEGYMSIM